MRIVFFACMLFILSTFSCDEINDLIAFNVDQSANFTIPSTVVVDIPINIPTPPINISSNQEFSQNNTNADLVKDVNLTKLDLNITAPDEKGFGFMESIFIYIDADGLNEVLLASMENIPEDAGQVISLETTEANLAEYIKAGNFSLRNNFTIREATSQEVDIRMDMTFRISAEIF